MNFNKTNNSLVIRTIVNNRYSPYSKPNKKQIHDIKRTLFISYPMKSYYNNVIPLHIYQTWFSKDLPKKMSDTIEKMKMNNPAFKHHLFDDNDCREFIKNNFNIEILNAFDSLIPGAYKADLWRYCILFKYGGIYLDVKYKPVKGFKLINLTEKEHFVIDRDNLGIYNALIVSLPNNPYLWKAIQSIVLNVKNKYYGLNNLSPTGPHLLSKIIPTNNNIIDMRHDYFVNMDNRYIIYKNFLIFKSYNGYIEESASNSNKSHYSILWSQRNIYR